MTRTLAKGQCSDGSANGSPSSANKDDIEKVFLDHVKKVVIDRHEPRTLQGLLEDYNSIIEKHNQDKVCQRSATLKALLQDKFGSQLGFHERFHINKNTIVYNADLGGSYIECAINSWGIDDDLYQQFCKVFKEEVKWQIFNELASVFKRFREDIPTYIRSEEVTDMG